MISRCQLVRLSLFFQVALLNLVNFAAPESDAPSSRITRPPTSPNTHGRSRSELPPSSPRAEPVERISSTVTISTSSYATRHRLEQSNQPPRASSSLSYYRDTSNDPSAPDEFGSTRGAARRSLQQSNSLGNHAPVENSAALRKRMLYGVGASGGSSSSLAGNSSPDYAPNSSISDAGGPTPSPPLLRPLRAHNSIPEESRSRSSTDQVRSSSPKMIPYAARTLSSSRGASPQLDGSGPSSGLTRSNSTRTEETIVATTRPASSNAMYRDEPITSTASMINKPASQVRIPVLADNSSSQPNYQDENAYESRPHPVRQPLQPVATTRQALVETYRTSNGAQPMVVIDNSKPSGYPRERVQANGQSEYHVPLRDGSPGMGDTTPGVTAMQRDYVGSQVADQRYLQQQQQQQMMMQQQQQQPFPVQQQMVPAAAKPRKPQAFLFVSLTQQLPCAS